MSALYQTITDTIVEVLNKGVVPWCKPWSSGAQAPVNALSNKPYRGVNVLLLSLSPYADHRWLTFKQVQEREGAVRKGERSTLVVFWKRWQPPATPDEDESRASPEIPVLRYFRVFNIEQCEGLSLPELYRPAPLSEDQRIQRAELMAGSMPDPPKRVERKGGAFYRPKEDLVQIPPLADYRTPDDYYATLFHELGHATGHERRLNRPGVTGTIQFGSGEYSKEELVAELTSAFCCATLALDKALLESSASYIGGWLKVLRSDPKAVVMAAAQAQRATDLIKGVSYQDV